MFLLIRNYLDNINIKKKLKMFLFFIGFFLKIWYYNLKNYLGLKKMNIFVILWNFDFFEMKKKNCNYFVW